MTMMPWRLAALFAASAALCAGAADDRFVKEKPDSMNGFMVVKNEQYLKECGACHFAYLPGLLPERSWKAVMTTLDKHFGENIAMSEPVRAALLDYLSANAADRSPYLGSRWLNENIAPTTTSRRITLIPWVAYKHTVVLEAIARNFKIEVRKLTNCDKCHTEIENGSIGILELYIPGLTKANIIKGPEPRPARDPDSKDPDKKDEAPRK
jgi:Dihaem cytochrome c